MVKGGACAGGNSNYPLQMWRGMVKAKKSSAALDLRPKKKAVDSVSVGRLIAGTLPSAVTRTEGPITIKNGLPIHEPKGCHQSQFNSRTATLPSNSSCPSLQFPKKIHAGKFTLHSPEKSTFASVQYSEQQLGFHHVLIPARSRTAESGGVMELKMAYRNHLPFLGADALDAIARVKPFNARTSVVSSTADLARAISLHVRSNKMKSLPKIFKLYDRDNSGELDKEQLSEAIRYYLPGTNITHASLNRIFNLIDIDGNGGINYDDFTAFVSKEDIRVAKLVDAETTQRNKMKETWVVPSPPPKELANTIRVDQKTTHATTMRVIRSKQFFTTQHRKLSQMGGVHSAQALPSKALLEENPDFPFIDPESLSMLKTTGQSLSENIRMLKKGLIKEVSLCTKVQCKLVRRPSRPEWCLDALRQRVSRQMAACLIWQRYGCVAHGSGILY
jgi:hypothetical protein